MPAMHNNRDGEITIRDRGNRLAGGLLWTVEFLQNNVKIDGATGQYRDGKFFAVGKQTVRGELIGARMMDQVHVTISMTLGFRRFSDNDRAVAHDVFTRSGSWRDAVTAMPGIWAFDLDLILRGTEIQDRDTRIEAEACHVTKLTPLEEGPEIDIVSVELEVLGGFFMDRPISLAT